MSRPVRLREFQILRNFRLRSRSGCGYLSVRPFRERFGKAYATFLKEGHMKKLLLATSALVATAGIASAQGGG